MKKILACMALIATLSTASAKIYPTAGIVTNVTDEVFEITLADGESWEWEGRPIYEKGDVLAMIIDDLDTPDVSDDEILAINDTGYWVALFEIED